MRKLLCLIFALIIFITSSFSQKIYFPASLYSDPNAFDKAIAGVAEKIISNLSDNEKKDHQKLVEYYMLSGNYQKAIEQIDSLQKKKDDPIESMELKIYAAARLKEKRNEGSFEKLFKQDYETAFNKLSFKKRVALSFDSSIVKLMTKDYKGFVEKLKNNKEDSLTEEDAKELSHKYAAYKYYREVYALIAPIITAPQYKAMLPAIKSAGFMSSVVPVQDVDEKPDPNIRYKLLMELTAFDEKEEAVKEINGSLVEVARKINLHVAAGIPKSRIDLVIVVHAGALYAFMNNEKYKRKFGVDNPNIELIKELQNFGANVIVCGQAMTWLHLEKSDMLPGIKQALTAQTVLSTYELKGYKFYNVSW